MQPPIELYRIYCKRPCLEGWTLLLRGLDYEVSGSRTIEDTFYEFVHEHKVSLGDIAYNNGVDDALWCARAYDPLRLGVQQLLISEVLLPALERIPPAMVTAVSQESISCVKSCSDNLGDQETMKSIRKEFSRIQIEQSKVQNGSPTVKSTFAHACRAGALAATSTSARPFANSLGVACGELTRAFGYISPPCERKRETELQVEAIIEAFPLLAFNQPVNNI